MNRRTRNRRSAFSLLELLVVITILGLLAALSTAAVQKYRALGDKLRAQNEMAELSKAVQKFCHEERLGAIGFMPSRITINGGDLASRSFFAKMFPKTGGNIPGLRPGTLEGHQCLVFFLAGPHVASKRTWTNHEVGWSTDPDDPAKPGGERIVFYEFKTNRLFGSGYLSYQDPWGTPYAYFSATANAGDRWVYRQYSDGDCASLNVFPYKHMNVTDNGFQIISAGSDRVFGTGGAIWTPLAPYSRGNPGFDDLANFHGTWLGGR